MPSQAVAPAPAAILASEIIARYALHRVKACLGEPIEIVTTGLGGIEVRGLAETAKRKEELTVALQDIQFVTVKIQTLAEAQATITRAKNSTDLSAQPRANATEDVSVVTVRSSKLPIQDELQRYFSQPGHPAFLTTGGENTSGDIHQKIAAFSSQAISLADLALADAFALRQLAEKYPPANTRSLEASNRWLLEAMTREHLQAIQATTLRSRSLLGPVLRSLEAGNELAVAGEGHEATSSNSEWTGQVRQLFEATKRIERLTAFLFAGASLPEEQAGQAPAKLLAAFDYIDQETRRLVDSEESDSATLTRGR
jgi:hypothetical protein